MYVNKLHKLQSVLNELEKNSSYYQNILNSILSIIYKNLYATMLIGVAGNGGSHSQADHFVGEMVGRYKIDRNPLPFILFNSQGSTLTAISNDYSYEDVILREVEAYKYQLGCVIFLSTSGNSKNLVKAAKYCKKNNIDVISLLGKDGRELKKLSTESFIVPCNDTPIIQEVHITILHYLAQKIEKRFFCY